MTKFDGECWICSVQETIEGKSGGSSDPAPAGNTTTTQNSAPWSAQQPYLSGNMLPGQTYGLAGTGAANGTGVNTPISLDTAAQGNPGTFQIAQGLYNNYTPQYFPGSTVSGFTPAQEQGQAQELGLGTSGTSAVNSAGDALTNFNDGSMLSASNPYFSSMANNVMSSVVPGIEATFNGGNRMGSAGGAYATAQGATDALGNIAYQNYNDQTKNMLGAAALSPAQQTAQYQNAGAVQDVGNQQQTQNQAQLTNQVNAFNFQQQLPYNLAANYDQMVNGTYGGTSTLTQPYYTAGNSAAGVAGGVLGGGLSGAAAGSAFGPYGTAGGAILGGLLGGKGSSDRRLKRDIKRIATWHNGLPLYSFRYIGDAASHVGFMADEVETVHPDAVEVGPMGFKIVDYRLAVR